MNVVPAGGGVAEMKSGYQSSLRILMVVCGLVLLIACANLANLLLARGSARGTQAAVRLAMGATKMRMVRQSLDREHCAGGAGRSCRHRDCVRRREGDCGACVSLGALCSTSMRLLRLRCWGLPSGWRLLTGLLFGTAPAWFAARTNPAAVLHGAGRSTRDGRALPQKALVVVQATLSVVLLTGAGLSDAQS